MERVHKMETAVRQRQRREREASGEETQEAPMPPLPDKPRRKTREQRLLESTIPLGPAEESADPDSQARVDEAVSSPFLLGALSRSEVEPVDAVKQAGGLIPHLPAVDEHLVRDLEKLTAHQGPAWDILLEEASSNGPQTGQQEKPRATRVFRP
jgi:hypothetical protein